MERKVKTEIKYVFPVEEMEVGDYFVFNVVGFSKDDRRRMVWRIHTQARYRKMRVSVSGDDNELRCERVL